MRSPIKALATLGVVIGIITVSVPAAQAAALGNGNFLGEFSGNVNSAADINAALGNAVPYQEIARWDGLSSGDVLFVMTAFKDGLEPIGGIWTYLDSTAISMLLTVKYGDLFSIFEYPAVGLGDTGLFASDPALTGFPMSANRNGQPFAISHIEAWSFATLSVIPLPATALLFASTLAALGALRLRRA